MGLRLREGQRNHLHPTLGGATARERERQVGIAAEREEGRAGRKRARIEIVADIMLAALYGEGKTRIMYRTI